MNTEPCLTLFQKAIKEHQQRTGITAPDKQLMHYLSTHNAIIQMLPEAFSLLTHAFDQRELFWETGLTYFEVVSHFLMQFRDHEEKQEDKGILLSKITIEWFMVQQWMMCWRASNAFMSPPAFWTTLFDFYAQHHQSPHCQSNTSPLTGLPHQTAPATEFYCLLILSVSGLDSFRSDQIVYALHLSKLLAPHLMISDQYENRYRFGVNLAEPSMPSIIRDEDPKDRTFFFTIPNFSARFQTAVERLGEYKNTPVAAQKRVQHIMNQQWGMKKENRRMYERKKVDFSLHIAIGHRAVLATMALDRTQHNITTLLQKKIAQDTEISVAQAQDTSMGGFGIIIPDFQKTPIVIGALLALDIPNAGSWRIGLTRRIRRINKQEAFIGIQLLSSEACLAPMTEHGKKIGTAIVLPDLKQRQSTGIILPLPCTNYEALRIDTLTENAARTYQPQADVWMSGPAYQLVGAREVENQTEDDNSIHDWFNEPRSS